MTAMDVVEKVRFAIGRRLAEHFKCGKSLQDDLSEYSMQKTQKTPCSHSRSPINQLASNE